MKSLLTSLIAALAVGLMTMASPVFASTPDICGAELSNIKQIAPTTLAPGFLDAESAATSERLLSEIESACGQNDEIQAARLYEQLNALLTN